MIDDKTDKLIFEGVRSQKQKLCIMLYLNPESETYDNATKSYMLAYDTKNTNVAAVQAHRMFNKEHIIKAMDRYKSYIHEKNGFELDWLDSNLRNLYYKVKNEGIDLKLELQTLKIIGDRIGAFKDAAPNNVGKFVELTPEQEQVAGRVMDEIMAIQKRQIPKELN
jgi:hypothetical protein